MARWYSSEEGDPEISVVIPTYPASDHRSVCRSLAEEQTFDEFEIVVVDDASLDICEARNEGIAEADGSIVALTDDDVDPPSDWLATIWRLFQENDDLGLVEGRVEGGINYGGTGIYVGCNLAFRRSAALEIGGFNRDYAGWRDDTEFGWRMERESDRETAYCDDVRMVHPPFPRANLLASNEKLLKMQYPDRYRERLNHSPVQRLWRFGMRIGIVPFLNRIRNPSN